MQNGLTGGRIDPSSGMHYRGPDLPISFEDCDPKFTVKVKTFYLCNEEDRAEYENVLQQAIDKKATIRKENESYDPDTKNWIMFLTWIEYYLIPNPEKIKDHLNV